MPLNEFPAVLEMAIVHNYYVSCEQLYTQFVSAQEKNYDPASVAETLRRYQVSRGLAWHKVAEKLGLSRGMLMMVLRGDRRLSAKALFRLEKAEREAAESRSAAERIIENLGVERDLVSQILGREQKKKATVEIPVDYQIGKTSKSFPNSILLVQPSEQNCRKLRKLFVETLDTKVVTLACLPSQLRSEGFIDQLAAESRTRLTNAALTLVMPDWRTLIAGGM